MSAAGGAGFGAVREVGYRPAVPPAHLPPHVLDALRQKLYAGDQFDPAQARQLLAEVDLFREELGSSRRDFARKAAGALGKRLQDVAAFQPRRLSVLSRRGGAGVPGEVATHRGRAERRVGSRADPSRGLR
jgi:hypothetical protein